MEASGLTDWPNAQVWGAAMTTMPLRRIALAGLIDGSKIETNAYRFERRRANRVEYGEGGVAVFTDDPGPGKIVNVRVEDASETGLKVRSSMKIEPGASFSLVTDRATWTRHVGIVVRCEKQGDEYVLGLRSKMPRRAA
jgi:hypothetical protein